MMMIVAALAVFLGLLAVGFMAIAPTFTSVGSRRLQSMDEYVGKGQAKGAVQSVATPSAISEQILGFSDKLTRERESTAKTAMLLERADLALRANEWYVLRAVAAVVVTASFWVMFHSSAVIGLIAVIGGAVLGFFAPQMFLSFKAKRRAGKFEAQLPDVLTLLASSLSTGFSLAQGVDAVVRDASEPSAKEFSRALAETRIGATLEDTLDHLAKRMASENLTWTTMAIRIQREVGGNLAETLRTTATTLRDRESLKRHVKGLSAEGKLSAYILMALPFGLFFYMLLVNKPYIALLWSGPIGWAMMAVGIVDMIAGYFWMRSVVTVEV
jgi:tight adherence protein B